MKTLTLILTLMLFGTAFGQQSYTDKNLGFEVKIPPGWALKTDLQGAQFVVYRGTSRVLLVTEPVKAGTTCEQFARANMDSATNAGGKPALPLCQPVDLETIDGEPVWVFAHYLQGKKGTLRMTSYAVVHQGTGYLFSAVDYKPKVKGMQADLEALLRSVKFN